MPENAARCSGVQPSGLKVFTVSGSSARSRSTRSNSPARARLVQRERHAARHQQVHNFLLAMVDSG